MRKKETLPYLVYKEISSLEYGLIIAEKNSYIGAQRDVTFTSVPGRNGDLIIDNGRYKNVNVTYKLSLINRKPVDFGDLARLIKVWLLREQGYFKLWDVYDERYFRLAAIAQEVNIEQQLKQVGSLSLTFNAKPFKYSYEGQKPIILDKSQALYNAEAFPAKPYIKIVGSGDITLKIGGDSFKFTDVDGYIEVDSELMDAYKGAEPQNGKMSADGFPLLYSGDNNISWSGDVEQLEIIPRWCSL